MISAIFLINALGETIISRFYREDVSRLVTEAFRLQVIGGKDVKGPVVIIDRTSYLYIRKGNVYIVAVTKTNSHAGAIFEVLYKLIHVFESYFGAQFDENSIRNNFVVIYELLDECIDFGYPQILAVDLLTKYIKSANSNEDKIKSLRQVDDKITSEITGAIDWREPDKYKYRKNEVYIDIVESVNLLKSVKGEVLKNDVSGKVMVKTFLSGMPECKFGMNDKLVLEKDNRANKKSKGTGIAIEDIRFHRCVKLGKFDSDRTISFIPPDGEFELMSYRVTQNITQPFTVNAVVSESGKKVEYNIKVKSNFPSKLYAQNVVINIPAPKNAAKHTFTVKSGKVKYDPTINCLVWKFKKFTGSSSYDLTARVECISTMDEKVWSRPPITMDFQVPMFTSSGMHVRFLKVTEKSNYDTAKWVRYVAKAGSYQIRI